MTPHVAKFIFDHRQKLKGNVLDVGALNVNGSASDIIPIQIGMDIRKGRGVNLVADVKDLPKHFADGYFDAVVSFETLEHVEDWKAFFRNTWNAVKEGGYIVMSMASPLKKRHAYPDDYWRFTVEQICQIYPKVEWAGELGKVSIGWVVKKEGDLPEFTVEPHKVK